MTIKEIIDNVDDLKPNAFSYEQKTRWISDLEGQIQAEIHLIAPPDIVRYVWQKEVTVTGVTFPSSRTMQLSEEVDFPDFGRVTIEGLISYANNNGTFELRNNAGDKLIFDDGTFTTGSAPETGEVKITYDGSGVQTICNPPHEKLYIYYLLAMIDFHNGEYDRYANTLEMFNSMYSAYCKWFTHHYDPGTGACF